MRVRLNSRGGGGTHTPHKNDGRLQTIDPARLGSGPTTRDRSNLGRATASRDRRRSADAAAGDRVCALKRSRGRTPLTGGFAVRLSLRERTEVRALSADSRTKTETWMKSDSKSAGPP